MKHKLIRKHTGEEFDCLNEVWDFIEIKISSIKNAGLGVFATEKIPKDTLIDWYKGVKVKKAIQKKYAWNFTCDVTNEKVKLEAVVDTNSNPMAFVNSFADKEQFKLLNLKRIVINGRLYYMTIKDILKGDELIVDYQNRKYFK